MMHIPQCKTNTKLVSYSIHLKTTSVSPACFLCKSQFLLSCVHLNCSETCLRDCHHINVELEAEPINIFKFDIFLSISLSQHSENFSIIRLVNQKQMISFMDIVNKFNDLFSSAVLIDFDNSISHLPIVFDSTLSSMMVAAK